MQWQMLENKEINYERVTKKAKIPERNGLMSETKRLINTLCKEMRLKTIDH